VVLVSVNELRPRQAVVHTYFTLSRVTRELSRRRLSLLQVQGCQWKHVVRSWHNVALNKVMCACFDLGYVLSDIIW